MQSYWMGISSSWAGRLDPEPNRIEKRTRNDHGPLVLEGCNPTERPLSLNLTFGLPSQAMPAARTRAWGHHRVTDATIEKTHELMLKGRPGASATLSLMRAYCRWRRANDLDSEAPGRALGVFGAYLAEAGLKMTTCASYVRSVLAITRKDNEGKMGCEWNVVNDVLKGLDLSAAAEEPDHAIDIGEDRAQEIIDVIRELDVQFSLWAMCTIGGRMEDLNNLGGGQLFLRRTSTPMMMSVDFRITKAGRTQVEKYSVTLPVWLPWKETWNVFLEAGTPFTANADRVNRVLHAAGYNETTYSFRRLFINRIVDRFTDRGVTEWCKVIEITGHQQARVVKGTYKIPDAQRQLKKVGPKKGEKTWVFE